MQAEFRKTGERRYAVIIKRAGLPDLEMDPAPGFDALMPHDLLHFIVEQKLGLSRGIYGQIAGGGTAGTFRHRSSAAGHDKTDSRLRRKTARRGKKLLKTGLDDCARSERATCLCLYDWYSHAADEDLRRAAEEMKSGFESLLGQMPAAERKAFSPEKRAAIRARMDELSRRWSALSPGESLTLEWTLSEVGGRISRSLDNLA